MTTEAWLDPSATAAKSGEVIFRSERDFLLWAYAVGHSQLLLRSTSRDLEYETTIDLLFKPISAIKIRDVYKGLVIRCAPAEQIERIKGAFPSIEFLDDDRFFLLETEGETDYVVSLSVGWREGVLGPTGQSFFAWIDPDRPQWPKTPFGPGYDSGLNIATVEELVRALANADDSEQIRCERYRNVYVVMTRIDNPDGRDISGAGVFLTEADAEDARATIAPSVADSWIEEIPIAI